MKSILTVLLSGLFLFGFGLRRYDPTANAMPRLAVRAESASAERGELLYGKDSLTNKLCRNPAPIAFYFVGLTSAMPSTQSKPGDSDV